MSTYYPDGWVIVQVKDIFKVFASWSGGYTQPDSWKLNSGIKLVEELPNYYKITGYSESVYFLNKGSENRLNVYGHSVLSNMINDLEKKNIQMKVIPIENVLEILNDS